VLSRPEAFLRTLQIVITLLIAGLGCPAGQRMYRLSDPWRRASRCRRRSSCFAGSSKALPRVGPEPMVLAAGAAQLRALISSNRARAVDGQNVSRLVAAKFVREGARLRNRLKNIGSSIVEAKA
jgi:hypothetical protein